MDQLFFLNGHPGQAAALKLTNQFHLTLHGNQDAPASTPCQDDRPLLVEAIPVELSPLFRHELQKGLRATLTFLRFSFFMVLGRNLRRTPQLSNLKSYQDTGSVRRGAL